VRHFVFGFGSLISRASRFVTVRRHSPATPVLVRGLARSWNARVPVYGMTAVGVVRDARAQCNGVVFPVTPFELARLDRREISATRGRYRRVLLHPRHFDIRPRPPRDARVWVYVARRAERPDDECPIAQTYLDIVVSGCLAIGDRFARDFAATTDGWEGPWIEDRATMRYPRYRRAPEEHAAIDGVLAEVIPDEFARRQPWK